jgi:protein CpxP
MKRISLGLGAALIAVGLAGSSYVAAQGPGGPGPGRFGGPGRMGGPGGPGGMMGPGGILGPGFQRLDLSDAQKEQVKSIVDSHRDEMRTLGDKAMKAHQALDAAIAGDTFDESTVRTKAAEVANIEADMAVMRARVHNEVFQLLTPDQQKTLKEFQANMQQRMQERAGRGANRPPRQPR